ncbi:uncharacterized protein LOC110421522 [Herrania umbratica]|uniref:Uncharacterized protein LOC110421522 n=1 Tax=Herrania umbratica TaxID=108875 RepID=A0A6J1AUE7_9ROSI|nr:uncharacterized protein LOC110421522 [Herrania umbratica]
MSQTETVVGVYVWVRPWFIFQLYIFKRRRRKSLDSSTPVDQVPADMLWSIFNRLDVIDIIRAKLVCSSWNSLGEDLVPRTPWLMLPSKEEVEGRYDADNNAYSGFLKLGESQVCSPKKIPKEFRQVKIRLPSLYATLGLQRVERKADGVSDIAYFDDSEDYFRLITCQHKKQHLREYFIQKAILTGEPNCNNKKCGVILLCNHEKIGYHESEDRCWTEGPDARHPPYQDIIRHENHLLALGNGNNIEIWNFQGGFMRKIRYIVPPFPGKSLTKRNSLGDLCTSRLYLVESCGDILLVVRFIGEFVESDGTLISEEDALYGIGIQPKVCP